MKEIVKKILEAGLVDKHTALLFEKWRAIDAGAAELVGKADIRKVSEEALEQFADELSVLIEEERTSFREIKLSITMKEPPILVSWVMHPQSKIAVWQDEMGHFVFPVEESLHLRTGNRFQSKDTTWEIIDATPLYVDDKKYAYLVKASILDSG